MTEPAAITAARDLLRAYYNCQPLPRLAEQLADALAEWRPAGETPIDAELLAETQRCLREAIAENERLRAALTEQDQLRGATEMIDDRLRIERLVRANARRAMVIDIIERLVEDPEREDFGPSDMEYWSPLHDALCEKLRAAMAEPTCKDDLQDAEPFIWHADDTGDTWTPEAVAEGWAPTDLRPLYTHPPRRKWVPLTEPEMHTLDWPHSWRYDDVRAFCESVEAKLREMNS